MKTKNAMNSDLIAYFQEWIRKMLPNNQIIDMFMENKHIVAVLNNDLHIKIKQ